jgi:N-acyl-D-amino-acid deacylase
MRIAVLLAAALAAAAVDPGTPVAPVTTVTTVTPGAPGAVVQAQVSRSQALDVILRHGTIVDGTGLPRYSADLGIAGDRIAAIGDLTSSHAAIELDVTGLFVVPGFINLHSHAVASALPTAENMLQQGVTTEILNPDGGGPTGLADQLSRVAGGGLAVNVGGYIGFNAIWTAVMGVSDRRAGEEDIRNMRAMIAENLAAGAWGVSAGLDYKPAYYATTREVISVVEVASKWRTNFPNHDRLTPEAGYSSRAGIGETIAIGEQAGLVPVITHMKIQGREQGRAPEVLGAMRAAAERGHYTAADAYPYLAGQTSLDALIIPAWAQDGGRAAMLKRFADPGQRARIVAEAETAMSARFGGAEGVYLPVAGRQLVDVMRELHASAGETVVRILEEGTTSAILRFGAEPDLVKVLQYPTTSVACDCGASTAAGMHPRYFGTFPRVLGHYVRDTHALTWEDAVRKMTGLPANIIGMVDRGFLAQGMAADVTVFDPATVVDHATYEDPMRPSDGIRHVIVNGRLELRDGKPTGERGGRALVRTEHMPSRAMSVERTRRVSFSGHAGEAALSFDVSQKPGARAAHGFLQLDDARSDTHVRIEHFGLLQTSAGWATFTGRARVTPAGDDRALTVIVDRSDPLAPGHGAQIIMDGAYRLGASVSPQELKNLQLRIKN